MVYDGLYERVVDEINTSDAARVQQIKKAVEYAKGNMMLSTEAIDEDFVIIEVEGYSCVVYAKKGKDRVPKYYCGVIELGELTCPNPVHIFPFDKDRIYPMQALELKPCFKVVRF